MCPVCRSCVVAAAAQGSNLTRGPSLYVLLPLSHPFFCLPTWLYYQYTALKKQSVHQLVHGSIYQSMKGALLTFNQRLSIWKTMIIKRLHTKRGLVLPVFAREVDSQQDVLLRVLSPAGVHHHHVPHTI